MKYSRVPFHDRKLWVYYALFFSGSAALFYQAMNYGQFGDSFDLLCLLFLIASFSIRRKIHILENSILMTCGYILPLLIRNTMKLSYSEAPSGMVFLELGAKSAVITLCLGLLFSSFGFLFRSMMTTFIHRQKVKRTIQAIQDKRPQDLSLTPVESTQSEDTTTSI